MSSPSEIGPNLFKQIEYRQTENGRKIEGFQPNLYRERFRIAKNLYKSDLYGHYGCVNAIEFSNGGDFLASGGDDKRVLLWHVEKSIAGLQKPRAMETEHQSNIFCLGFDKFNRKVFSGGNDDLVISHDFDTGKLINVYKHDKPVLGLSVDLNSDNVFATACEDGQIALFDQRKDSTDPLIVASYRTAFHAVQFHPYDGNYLVTANSKKGTAFWDVRAPQVPVIQYGNGYEDNHQSCMSVRFNSSGSLIIAIRRRLPPVLYSTFSTKPVCQFYHPDYYNSCTMKSCTFAGEDDEYVLSGSDDFNLYVWRVHDADLELTDQWIESTKMVLHGHRSIVNQVRYNPEKCLLASSGIEKIVKLWSPFEQRGWNGTLTEESTGQENPREVISREAYATLLQNGGAHMTHDYSTQNTSEDVYMMAYFDSLIQQELEGWDSNNSSDSDLHSVGSSVNTTHQSSIEDSDEEELVRYFGNNRDRHRRNTVNSTMKPQRNKYANRIAYLIATKRNTLRRLALKGTSHSNRRRSNLPKAGRLNSHRSGMGRTSRNAGCSKRSGRYNNAVFRGRRRSDQTTAVFRALRRKSIRKQSRVIDSSSDEDDDGQSSGFYGNRTNGEGSVVNIAIPSTSTGITSSGKDAILRLRQQQLVEYSDDDDDDDNSDAQENANQQPSLQTEILPPVNGLRNHIVATEAVTSSRHNSSDENEEASSRSTPIRRTITSTQPRSNPARSSIRHNRKRHTDLDIYSSHSNSRLSNSDCLEDEHDSSDNENLDCFNKKRRIVASNNNTVYYRSNNNNDGNNNDGENANAVERQQQPIPTTPARNVGSHHSHLLATPDSGISSAANLTPISPDGEHNSNRLSSISGSPTGEKFAIKLFHQKVARYRRNFRKNFDESDSD